MGYCFRTIFAAILKQLNAKVASISVHNSSNNIALEDHIN